MDPMLLSLVVSPGGADAVGAMMAKAPPGEGPPDLAGTFLQLLARAFPKGLPWDAAPQADTPQGTPQTVKAEKSADKEKGAGEKPAVPQDAALQLVALLFPAGQLVITPDSAAPLVEQAVAEAVASPVAAVTQDLGRLVLPVLAAEDFPAPTKEVGSPEPAVPDNLRPPPLLNVQADPVLQELLTAIPAPEVREGSVKTETTTAAPRVAAESRVTTGNPTVSVNPPTVPTTRTVAEIVAPEQAPQQVSTAPEAEAKPANVQDARPRLVFSAPLASMLEALSMEEGPKAEVAPKVAQPEISVRQEVPAQQILEHPQVLVEHMELAAATAPRSEQAPRKVERTPDNASKSATESDAPVKTSDGVKRPSEVKFEPVAPVQVKVDPDRTETEPQTHKQEPQAVHVTQPEHPTVAQPEQQASREQVTAIHAQADRMQPVRARAATPDIMQTQVRTKLTEELARNVVDQVMKQVSFQVKSDSSEMRMRLDPPTLGEVHLTVRVEEGKMQAQIDVTQPSVKAVLESNIPQLRQSLTDRGIEVQRIDIFTSGESLTKHPQDGRGDRPHRRESSRSQSTSDGVDQYRASRQLGYNTIEVVM